MAPTGRNIILQYELLPAFTIQYLKAEIESRLMAFSAKILGTDLPMQHSYVLQPLSEAAFREGSAITATGQVSEKACYILGIVGLIYYYSGLN